MLMLTVFISLKNVMFSSARRGYGVSRFNIVYRSLHFRFDKMPTGLFVNARSTFSVANLLLCLVSEQIMAPYSTTRLAGVFNWFSLLRFNLKALLSNPNNKLASTT